MINKVLAIGFSLVFLIFVSNLGTNNLLFRFAIAFNSNTYNVPAAYALQSYHQWDPIIPVSYKTQTLSLGPFLEIGPKDDNDNNGIIFNEPIENITAEANKTVDQLNNKLNQLKDGILKDKDNPPVPEQQEEEEDAGTDEKETNGNEENSDDVNALQEEKLNPLERLQVLKQEQENIQKGENNGDDNQEPDTAGMNAEGEKNTLGDGLKIDQLNEKLQDLKDRLLNDQDNQRLIEQRSEDQASADQKEDDISNTYEGYSFSGFSGDNGDNNFNFAATGDFGCSTNTLNWYLH